MPTPSPASPSACPTPRSDSISWHGLAGDQFAVEYTANSVLLRVTAVPEPATVGLWALGLALIAGRKWRQHNRVHG